MTSPAPPAPASFRTLSLQDALGFGIGFLFSYGIFWGAAGLLMGVVHHFLLLFLGLSGGLSLAERLVEALFISVWPLAVAAEAATRHQDGNATGFEDLFRVGNLFEVGLSVASLSFISLGGAMVLAQSFAWMFPGAMEPLSRTLLTSTSVSAGWNVLVFAVAGGTVFGLPYVFGPFVAGREGAGCLASLDKSRRLTRDLRLGLFFLQGFLLVVLCGSYSLANKIPNSPTLAHHVLESLLISGTASVVGAVWNHAYRQAVTLDAPLPSLRTLGKRIHIPDHVTLEDLTERTP